MVGLEVLLKFVSDLSNLQNQLNETVNQYSKRLEDAHQKAVQTQSNKMEEMVKKYRDLYEKYQKEGYTRMANYYKKAMEDTMGKIFGKGQAPDGISNKIMEYFYGKFLDNKKLAGMPGGGLITSVLGKYVGVGKSVSAMGAQGAGAVAGAGAGLAGLGPIAIIVVAVLAILMILKKMLDSIKQMVMKGAEVSGYMKATFKLFDTAMKLTFKPLADVIGAILLPILIFVLRVIIIPFMKMWSKLGPKIFDSLMKIMEKFEESAGTGTELGAAIGAAVGIFGGPVGMMIGMIVGALFGAIVDAVIEELKNFGNQVLTTFLKNKKVMEFALKATGVILMLEGQLLSGLGALINAIKKFFILVINAIMAPIKNINDMYKKVQRAFGWEQTGMPFIEEFIDTVESFTERLQQLDFTKFGNKIYNVGKALWNMGDLINKYADEADSLSTLFDILTELGAKGIPGFENLNIEEIKSKIESGEMSLFDNAQMLIEKLNVSPDLAIEALEQIDKKFEELKKMTETKGNIVRENVSTAFDGLRLLARAITSHSLAAMPLLNDAFMSLRELLNWIKMQSDSVLGVGGAVAGGIGWGNPSMGQDNGRLLWRQVGGEIPETGLYLMHRGEIVIPSWKVTELAKGKTVYVSSLNVSVNVDRISSDMDIDELARELAERIMREIEIRGGM